MKNTILLTFLLFFVNQLFAQQSLPYQTGFDNAAQQAGWLEHRTGFNSFYNWNISGGTISPPNSLHHDYPVGSGTTDTTTDWFVSPALLFNGASKIKLKFIVYSITGNSVPVDQFGIWYSSTGADPATNNYVQVAEFKSYASTSNAIIDTSDIQIPSVAGTGYIAIKYQTTQNWFVITVDEIEIESEVSSVEFISGSANSFSESILLSNGKSIQNPFNELSQQIIIHDLDGRKVSVSKNVSADEIINTNELSSGIYFAQMLNDKVIKSLRLIVQ